MITKAEVVSVDRTRNSCVINMPLFQNASNPSPVITKAYINITPGMYNNIFEGDIVFVGFEENRIENPIILGKLYRGVDEEGKATGGAGRLDTLHVETNAAVPAAIEFNFPDGMSQTYADFKTHKSTADKIKQLDSELNSLSGKFLSLVSEVSNYFASGGAGGSYGSTTLTGIDDGDLSLVGNVDVTNSGSAIV